MNIRKDKFLASLLAFGLAGAGAVGCGSSEGADETTADTDMTTGGDTMAEPTDTTGMDTMGDPGMEGDTTGDTGMGEGDDMGADDMGPTPE